MISELVSSALNGNRRDIGRLLTVVENRSAGYEELMKIIRGAKKAFVIGVTGPPGVGKSSLISRLSSLIPSDRRMAIIMIDATSPFSGGSLLGNRLRLEEDRVYVRSMATRGSTGGLSLAIGDSIDLLSFLGFKTIIVESVGTGQDETDILYYADIVLMVLSPGLGDEIQAIKAGQMEIGDFVVLNKADKPEALIAEKELMEVLSIPDKAKKHELFRVSCLNGQGLQELADALRKAMEAGVAQEDLVKKEKERIRREADAAIRGRDGFIEKLARRVVKGEISREEAIRELFDSFTSYPRERE
ncbi:MAG: ArgK/MeaB family GTPase [Thermoplasmata archaeon]